MKIVRQQYQYVLTTFCYGSGMGPKQTAKHIREKITSKVFIRINKKHVTVEALRKANTRIADYANIFPIIQNWGDGERCAVDGTFNDIYDNNLIAEYHFRYRKRGAVAYHQLLIIILLFFQL